jgi:hypothetical protein
MAVLIPCLEQELIPLELHQHVVPETRAVHPVGGERLLGAMNTHPDDPVAAIVPSWRIPASTRAMYK